MQELSQIKGIGPKKLELFYQLGIFTIEDLVTYYPYKYHIIKRTNMTEAIDGEKIIIDGILEHKPIQLTTNSHLKKFQFRISTTTNLYQVILFNQEYLCKELYPGMPITVFGKYDQKRNTIIASEIRKGKLLNITQIEPIYYTKEGINRKMIASTIQSVLKTTFEIKNYLPSYLEQKYHFPSKINAIKEIHQPTSTKNYHLARQCLKYEELFLYLLKIQYLKQKRETEQNSISRSIEKNQVDHFIQNLPFQLTPDQQQTIEEIKSDLESSKRMNRLVQGDVGSGKTIIAFIATYMNFLSNYQTALMVPTEILAQQHYQNALSLFSNTTINIALLTSSTPKQEQAKIREELKSGKINFIIGTQSLIQENIQFQQLGLIITDEQHRFGVNQRNILKAKGLYPDILSMSATPIPRTYALTLYGDMDVSSIKTKPKGRKEVITKAISTEKITILLYQMKEELLHHHQIYVIAPSIEKEEDNELKSVEILKKKMHLAFDKIATIGVIHGKMKALQKEKVMHDFEKGEISILISTTVIEVGVNVPNASMIAIFQANLFGLSTIHQLRGRVGRGNLQSYCFLISNEVSERLKFLEQTTDGFQISEYDFKTRGEGDLFGTRQSGDAILKLANIKRDFTMLKKVKEDVEIFSKNNKEEFRKLESSLERIELVD